ncbi:MAG: hypothetical protein VCB07_08640 [Gammaproteobacteria bacterium]
MQRMSSPVFLDCGSPVKSPFVLRHTWHTLIVKLDDTSAAYFESNMHDLTYLLSILVGLVGFPIITLAAEPAGKVVFASDAVKVINANDLHRALTRGDKVFSW